MEGIDDPLDFKTDELQTLDENLRCPICKEFYDTAMILSTCSHSFCAMCIRRSLAAEQCCPKCRAPSHDSNLHNNYDLDNVISAWKISRNKILALENQIPAPSIDTDNKQTNPDDDFVQEFSSLTSSSRRSARLKDTTAKSEDPNLVTCPVCNQKMHPVVINEHVNTCLNGDSTIPPLPVKATIPILGKKPINFGKKPMKIVYDMYKEKDLRKMLKEYNLPDHGDRAQLIWRYKEYLTMYNANMDSLDPVDISQLIRRIQYNEQINSPRTIHKRSTPDSTVHNILFLLYILTMNRYLYHSLTIDFLLLQQKYDNEYKALMDMARKKPKKTTTNESPSPQSMTPPSDRI
ncbi:hypothetical protein BC941DRAFT_401057 [Chlamydoabsidia padenii]|nr:hypothetical protein BC941DRAFT_401057 [Chlamydoabsidia padenii]